MKASPANRPAGGAGKPLANHSAEAQTKDTLPREGTARRELGTFDPEVTLSVSPQEAEVRKGRFRIIRPHAEGGLGRVFVAFDSEVGREVALKEIKVEWADDFDSRDRFTREAEITGNLEHPGIVPVYGQGAYSDGRPYYAMRFIRGICLKDAIDAYHRQAEEDCTESPIATPTFDLRRLLKRLIDVCQAMQYAHSRGVLHRDLKPSNVMLGPYGETLVVDWGLAKASGEASVALAADLENSVSRASLPDIPVMPQSNESAPTQLGSAVGTPAYMSPEQAQGRIDLLSPVSDVFSLGATLYHILTGQPPYQGGSSHETLRLAKEGKYPRPQSLAPDTPRALEAICLKAMDPVMTRRYASAAQLAHDLDYFLADEPVSAYRATVLERTARWIRRHKTTAAAVAVSLLAIMVAASVIAAVSWGYSRTLEKANADLQVARDTAVEEKRLAKEAEAAAEAQRMRAEERTTFIMRSFRDAEPQTPVSEVLRQFLLKEAAKRREASSPPE